VKKSLLITLFLWPKIKEIILIILALKKKTETFLIARINLIKAKANTLLKKELKMHRKSKKADSKKS
jgi:hypothetical protein